MKKPVKQVKHTRRVFTAVFKAEAVRRMTDRRGQGVSLQQIGRELDVSADMLRSWAHQGSGASAVPSALTYVVLPLNHLLGGPCCNDRLKPPPTRVGSIVRS